MPASFKEILKSPLIQFGVGQITDDGTRTLYLVHQKAITQLSQPLHDTLKGDQEVIHTLWPDVSRRTFERFVQFAYTGDYTIPKPPRRRVAVDEQEAVESEPSSSTLNEIHAVEEGDGLLAEDIPAEEAPPDPAEEYIESAAAPPADSGGGGWGRSHEAAPEEPTPEPAANSWSLKKKGKKGVRPVYALPPPEPERVPEPVPEPTDFASLSFELLAPRDNYKDICEPSERFIAGRNYSKVFLSHANLWALADIHGIDSLKALALYKLHKTLCVFEISSENAMDAIDLVRYVYSPECGTLGDDKLKGLVAQYMACNSAALCYDSNFRELLREGGLFVEDFLRLVIQRIL